MLTTNQWIHIAASYDAATDSSHIYINGVEVPVQDNHLAGNPDDALKSTVHPYYLGKRGDGGLPLNGSIAEFRIWNDVRTADEVRNNMNFGLEGDEANLVALWKLDEGSGTALDDATANNFGGTAFNTTWTTRAVSGGLAVNYTEGAVPVSLFSGATVSTVESGQSIIGLTLTVTNVSDTTERLAIDGSTIDLVDDTSGTTVSNGVNYTVNVSGGTATISLSKATGLTEAQTAALINGIAYSNSSEGPTTTNPRVITLTSMQDDGGGSGTATLTLTSTVTVFGANDAPTDIALSASTASTFDAGNYVVGYLSSTDVDTGDTHTYTLVSGDGATDNALFTISGNELRLTAPSGLTAGTYSARIRTTDSGSEFYEEAFTITVTDSLTVTAASDESFDSGTYAAELADGAGLSLREALAFALAGSKTVGFSAVLNGQTIALGSSATVPTATTLDSDGAGLLTISGQSLALDGALTVANGAGDLFTINSALTGAGSSLTKTGAGTLVLSSANTYTGTTTVSGGTLQTNSLGNSSGLNLDGGTLKTHSASLSSGAAIAVGGSGGTFDLSNGSMTFSGVVSGSGALIVDSTHAGNAIRFSGNNTYSGGTTLNNGILDLASTTALGSGALTVNGGKIRSTTSDWTLDNNLILGNTLTMSGSYALTFNGTVDLGGAIRTISNGLNTSDLTLNGAVINGALVVNNQTGGTLVLAGNNSYASTTISAGTLSITGDANLGSGTVALDGSTSKLQVTGAGIIDNAISLNNTSAVIGNTGAVALSGVLSGTGNLNKEGSGTLTLTGANTFTGNTAVNAGVLVVDGGSALSDSGTVSLGSAAVLALQVSETIGSLTGGPSIVALSGNTLTTGGNNSSATFSGNISGTGSLIKIGTGIFTLAGITEYTGATTVSQGTLQLDASGSLASSVTVATGATFDASGTSTTIVTIQTGGHLRINGDSVEDLVTGDLTLASGATFHADLGGATAGSGYDQINVNGAINLTGATLDLSLIGGFTPTIGNSFTLISNDGSDTVVGAFNGLAEGDKFVADGSRFTVSYTGGDGNDFVLTTIAPNTAPAIISNGGGATASINVVENSTAVATVEASDVDAGDTVTYSITGGADQAKFQIDATTGVLTFTTAPDFENPTDTGANNTYEVIVQADDTDGGSDTQTLTVTVTNVNEAPVNNVPSAQVVASNTDLVFSAANANLITISDADIGNNPAQITLTASNGLLTLGAVTGLSFTVGDGTSDATMTFTGTLADINAALDGLTFSPTSGFGGSASLTLDSSDQGFSGSGGSQTDSDTVAIMVNTAPAITSNGGSATASINVAENTTAVTTVQATDADVGQTLTYSLAGGADAAKFAINANTGALSFISAPNYEAPTDVGTDNTYEVIVRASDGTDADEQTLTVTVTDVNETVPPVQPPIQPTPTLIDGVSVQTTQQTSASGLTTTTVQIDPVSTGRVEDSTTPHNTLADIPLVTDATGATLLSTGLPVGIGIQSITQSGNDLTLRQQLINASEPRITDDTAWQQILSDGIDAYTAGVTAPSQVTVRTLVLTAASGSSAPGQPIVITGARGTGENDSAHPLRQEALIIDARTLPAGSVLSLDQVEFAIIIGPVTVTGGTGRNLVLGDGSAQILILGAEDDILHGGAGDDTVGSHGGDDQLYGDAGNDTVVGGEGHDTLDGGDGNDLLHGGQSDAGTWSFTLNAQHQLITTFTATTPNLVQHASETHTGAWSESTSALTGYGGITFADQPVGTLETLSLLCQALLQRFPDVAEMNYWANQGLTPQQLAQLAYHAHLGGQAIATSLTAQSADLIGWLWGDEAATPELTQAVADYIEHGGTWADVVLAGIRHDTFRGPLADADGTLTLTQSHHSGESGWSADIGHDTLSGGAGNDTLIGGRGSDTLDGGDGLDTAVFSGNRSASQFAWDGDILRIATGSDTDQLTGIERLRFADRKIAFDVTPDGNAGQMMAFIATVAPDHLDDLSARGLILGLLDSGETLLGLSQKALDLHLVPDDNADLANTLCQHVLNGQPTAERTQALTSYIEENGPASFIAAVAGLHLNIDLVGLQQSGVEYC